MVRHIHLDALGGISGDMFAGALLRTAVGVAGPAKLVREKPAVNAFA
jgi:uncharacterized protein (DUF111 family)